MELRIAQTWTSKGVTIHIETLDGDTWKSLNKKGEIADSDKNTHLFKSIKAAQKLVDKLENK